MKLFGDEVKHTSTNSPLNILQVENFSEIFFGVFEVELNEKKYPVEKISEYKGNPVVNVPIRVEGVDVLYPFVLIEGKSDILFNEKNLGLPSNDHIEEPTPEILEEYSLAKLTPPIVEEVIPEEMVIIDERVEDIIDDIGQHIDPDSRQEILKHIEEAKEAAKEAVRVYKEKQLQESSAENDRYNRELKKTLENARTSLVDEFVSISTKIKSELVDTSTDQYSLLKVTLENNISDLSLELEKCLLENFENSSNIFDNKIKQLISELYTTTLIPRVEKELNEIALQIVERLNVIEGELYGSLVNKADLSLLESFTSELDTVKKSNIELNDTVVKGINKALSRVGNVNTLVEKLEKDIDTRLSESVGNVNAFLEQIKKDTPDYLLEEGKKSDFDILKSDYDKLIHEKFEKYKVELRKYAISYGGGGGTVAQQFADGGTINGPLIINGPITATQYIGLTGGSGGGGGSDVSGLSANWQSTYNTVRTLSSGWGGGSNVSGLSANWETASSKVRASSANWDSVYNTVRGLSSGWGGGGGGSDVTGLSANWQNTFTTVASNSANWNTAYTTLSTKASLSGSSDIEITDFTKGIILRSPNGSRFRVTMTDSGALSSTVL